MKYNKEHKIRIKEWIRDGLPTEHIFWGSKVAKIGHTYFDREAVEKRCQELRVFIEMGACDSCHMFLLEILCPTNEDLRPEK